jgi:hypothetical protein
LQDFFREVVQASILNQARSTAEEQAKVEMDSIL